MNSSIGAGRPALVSADIPNNAADTTGTAAKTNALNSATTVVNVSAATAPTVGQILTATDSTHATWQAATGAGLGDVTGPAASVDSEVALFSGTGGKLLKRASASGIAKVTSGVLSAVTAPSGTIVGTTDSQVLTNKTLTEPTIDSFTNATHNHESAAGGGQLGFSALADGVTGDAGTPFVVRDNPIINGPAIGGTAAFTGGIGAGAGLQHVRIASNATGALAFSTVDTTVTWSIAFADVSYTLVATIDTPTGAPFVLSTKSKTTTTCVVTIANLTAGVASGTLNVIAMHD